MKARIHRCVSNLAFGSFVGLLFLTLLTTALGTSGKRMVGIIISTVIAAYARLINVMDLFKFGWHMAEIMKNCTTRNRYGGVEDSTSDLGVRWN